MSLMQTALNSALKKNGRIQSQAATGQGLKPPTLTVGVAGLGTIGKTIVGTLVDGIDGLMLKAIGVRDPATSKAITTAFVQQIEVMSATQLADCCDVIVDCAPSEAFGQIVRPALEQGRVVITVNATAMLDDLDIEAVARRGGGTLILATGALLGLDAVRAAAEGEIFSVKIVTRKPPGSLAQAPRMIELGLDARHLAEPVLMFAGSVREGARLFPANVNVAAALALAGVGPDATILEVWADPGLERNTHAVHVDADSARFTMSIENIPTEINPATGRISALSVVAALRRLVDPIQVGT